MTEKEAIKDAVLITAREHLEEVASELARFTRLAVDIESNGFYAYRERVCLIQLSSPECDYILDPIAVKDISALGPLFADSGIEKLFHAGEYDVLCLKRDYGFTFKNVFDTMIAARLLGFKELGLAAAIERHFGVKLSKKLQRADWGRRPLSLAQLQYAQLDTHYLMRLADIDKDLLEKKGRMEDAAEAFSALAALVPVERPFDPEGFWKLAAGRHFTGPQVAVLREVYLFRERQAQRTNKAPFRIMPEDLLRKLAQDAPRSLAALKEVRGMTPYLFERYGPELLAAVEAGVNSDPVDEDPRQGRPRRDPREFKLFEELRLWRKRKAQEQGVDPVVILSSAQLREIARLSFAGAADPLKDLSPLKRDRFGEELLKLLK